jgi:hypothetical protein
VILGLSVGVFAAVLFAAQKDTIIKLFLGPKKSRTDSDDGGDDDDYEDDDDERSDYEETSAILHQCWTLFCVCQVTNSIGNVFWR